MKIALCFNQISFTIAKAYADKYDKNLIILFSINRVKVTIKDKSDFNIKEICRLNLVFFALLSILGMVKVLLIPHHILGIFGDILFNLSKKVDYIDDGMDTLRNTPKNFNLAKYGSESTYYTFTDYNQVGCWLRSRKLVKICKLEKVLENDDKIFFDFLNNIVLVVEAPGIKTDIFSNKSLKQNYIFTHPSPLKQKKWDSKIHHIDRSVYSVEKTMLKMENGIIVIGESMSLLICIYSGLSDNATIKVYLDDSDNLTCLVELIKGIKNIKIMEN